MKKRRDQLPETSIAEAKIVVKRFKEFTDYKVLNISQCAREMELPKTTVMAWIHRGILPTKVNFEKLKKFLEDK